MQGAYFGVPLQNLWSWWLTTFVTVVLFLALGRINPGERPLTEERFDRLAIVSYAITGMSMILVVLQGGSSGPGLVGLFAMLPWVLRGWRRPIS